METQDFWMHKYLKYKMKFLQVGGAEDSQAGQEKGGFFFIKTLIGQTIQIENYTHTVTKIDDIKTQILEKLHIQKEFQRLILAGEILTDDILQNENLSHYEGVYVVERWPYVMQNHFINNPHRQNMVQECKAASKEFFELDFTVPLVNGQSVDKLKNLKGAKTLGKVIEDYLNQYIQDKKTRRQKQPGIKPDAIKRANDIMIAMKRIIKYYIEKYKESSDSTVVNSIQFLPTSFIVYMHSYIVHRRDNTDFRIFLHRIIKENLRKKKWKYPNYTFINIEQKDEEFIKNFYENITEQETNEKKLRIVNIIITNMIYYYRVFKNDGGETGDGDLSDIIKLLSENPPSQDTCYDLNTLDETERKKILESSPPWVFYCKYWIETNQVKCQICID